MDLAMNALTVRCCIAGGGPAGMMLGFLLARAGIEVAVLEKHADFFRDFRGDTIHPSTLDVMYELGLLDDFLALPHDEIHELAGILNDQPFRLANFDHVPTHCKFLALMPQWDFLNFLAAHAKRYPTYHLLMEADVTDLLTNGARVTGVRATTPQGPVEVSAEITIGADGRTSTVRDRAGLQVIDFGAPMDVLWMRLSRRSGDPPQTFGYIKGGSIFVMIGRKDYWQCGYVIPKGAFENIQRNGLDAFRSSISSTAPFLADRMNEIDTWDTVKLLTVRVDRLEEWCREGLLCIGDAAHAMSPIGGVGINLAIQDAVATANLLYPHFAAGRVSLDDLRAVQRRRTFPTRMTQSLQLFIQKRFITGVLGSETTPPAPGVLKLLQRFPVLRRLPAYVLGVGFRPEHVRTPDMQPADRREVEVA
jgi:2-polyprenyl-6-methoxyphenol hydroxylase-like FAD-dependent oxidoreductase